MGRITDEDQYVAIAKIFTKFFIKTSFYLLEDPQILI